MQLSRPKVTFLITYYYILKETLFSREYGLFNNLRSGLLIPKTNKPVKQNSSTCCTYITFDISRISRLPLYLETLDLLQFTTPAGMLPKLVTKM